MKESLKIVGNVKIHRNGILVLEKKNLVVTSGLNYITERMKEDTVTPISHIGIGTGATAADPADVALETPVGARKAVTTVTVTGAALEIVATFDGATYNSAGLREAGIFNDVAAGTMISRIVFAATPLPTTDSLQITWTLTLANA